MKILIFIVVAIFVFGLTLVGNWKTKNTIVYALAIGGAVNANFFSAYSHPIVFFGLPFGLDSIIYTLFLFCMIIIFHFYDKKSAIMLLISSVSAILFSAIITFLAEVSSFGFDISLLFKLMNFLSSIIATIFAVMAMIKTIEILQKEGLNFYWCVIFGLIVATLINSTIYYATLPLFIKINSSYWSILFASYLGKIFSIIIAMPCLYFLEKQAVKNYKP